jgi:hypothetical protein
MTRGADRKEKKTLGRDKDLAVVKRLESVLARKRKDPNP